MMNNIFNIFDPSTSLNMSLNWLSSMIILILFPYMYWITPSRLIMCWKLTLFTLFKEFNILIKYSFSNLIMFMSLFMLILFNNFMGLFPYIFTSSSHLSFSLSLSLTFWLSSMLFGWINFFNFMMTHLTPLTTPTPLMPFMVIIELISLLIRPITLSIRLSANMIAGHLLLSLLGSSGPNLTWFYLPLFMISQILLMILEIAVSMIQSYVFSILALLYSSEI